MTKDLNKGISKIEYNLLNLPQQVDILSPLAEARNNYSYSADGVKLRVVKKYNSTYNTSPIIGSAVNVSSMDVTKTTDYVDGKIFENNVLDRIFVDGGYIKGGVYYFYETDHLGDNRTVMNQSGAVVERNDYYPFGMQMAHNQLTNSASGSDNKRKFGGKELDVMGGLNLYDSQARSYDPTLGKFTTVDPLAEDDPDYSPYAYCHGNPINKVDPDGRWVESAWDIFSLGTGVASFVHNVKEGNVGAAIVDGIGIVADAAAVVVPLVPGGVGAGIKAVRTADKVADVVKGGKAAEKVVGGAKAAEKTVETSRAARREVMRKEGIPTSQQPKSQSKNASGREYRYDVPKKGGGKQTKSVQQQTKDRSHKGESHWEAGKVKTDENGNVRMNNYDRPKLENQKSKANYTE